MTTTRINHTGHDHPNTPAARAACRKNTATVPVKLTTPKISGPSNRPITTPAIVVAPTGPRCSCCGNTDLEDVSGAYSVCCNKRVEF